ncbi:hypothetical protein AB4Z54_63415, partial [Streptomyces sp. MCAF7]
MSGVGKNELAIEYVYRYESQYAIVWRMPESGSHKRCGSPGAGPGALPAPGPGWWSGVGAVEGLKDPH